MAKHEEISRTLLHEISGGKYGAAGRLPSEMQLVKRFGVSRPTVARAFRELAERGLIERRVGSGTFVCQRAPIAGATSKELGLMIPGLGTTEIFEAICGELASLARGAGYGLMWGSGERPAPGEEGTVGEVEAWCEQFIERRVRGVFFAPFERISRQEEVNRRLAERLRQGGIAVVLLDRDLWRFPSRSDFDLVGMDHFLAGYLVMEHLLKLGVKNPVFVARAQSGSAVQARIAGAREAMMDRGMRVPEEFLRVGEPEDSVFIQRLAETPGVDAAICANDQTAGAVIRGMLKKGVRVPEDLRVTGFDDVSFAALLSAPLTTLHQPVREIAVTAFGAMLERIQNPALPARSLGLTPRLVIRESCGAYLR